MVDWIKWTQTSRPESNQRCIVFVGDKRKASIVIAMHETGFRDSGAMWWWEEGEIGYYNTPTPTYCNAEGTFWMPLPPEPDQTR